MRNDKKETPLHLACSVGNDATARILVEHGADCTAHDKDGQTALHHACKHGKPESFDFRVEHGYDDDGENRRHASCVELLLAQEGVNVNTRDHRNNTPLHVSVQHSGNVVACMTVLLDNGAYIESQNGDGKTPLDLAREAKNDEAARVLVLWNAQAYDVCFRQCTDCVAHAVGQNVHIQHVTVKEHSVDAACLAMMWANPSLKTVRDDRLTYARTDVADAEIQLMNAIDQFLIKSVAME